MQSHTVVTRALAVVAIIEIRTSSIFCTKRFGKIEVLILENLVNVRMKKNYMQRKTGIGVEGFFCKDNSLVRNENDRVTLLTRF